jgi:hypothetical protein
MSISSIGGAGSSAYAQATQRPAQAAEAAKAAKAKQDSDGDQDGGAKVQTNASLAVNSSGQVVGQTINVTA